VTLFGDAFHKAGLESAMRVERLQVGAND